MSHTFEEEEEFLSHLRVHMNISVDPTLFVGPKTLCICHAFFLEVPSFLRRTNESFFRGCNEGFASQNTIATLGMIEQEKIINHV